MPKRILLADDSAATKTSVEKALGPDDYQLITVENGQAATDQINEGHPHLVLAHAMLPGIDGYDLCRQVKENPDTAHIPVFLLTGTFEPFDINRAKEVSYDGFVTKPLDQQELKSLISRSIENAVYPAADPVVEEVTPDAAADASDVPAEPAVVGTEAGSDAMLDRIFPDEQPIEKSDTDDEDLFSIVDPASDGGEPVFGGTKEAEVVEPLFPAPVPESSESDSPADEVTDRRSPDFGIWGSGKTVEPAEPEDATPKSETQVSDEPAASAKDSDLSWFLKKYNEKSEGGNGAEVEDPQEDQAVEAVENAVGEPEALTVDTDGPFFSPPEAEDATVVNDPQEEIDVTIEADPLMEAVEPLPGSEEPLTAPTPSSSPVILDDQQLEQLSRRVVELLSDTVVRDVAWEAVPEIAERLIRERIREIEAEADSAT